MDDELTIICLVLGGNHDKVCVVCGADAFFCSVCRHPVASLSYHVGLPGGGGGVGVGGDKGLPRTPVLNLVFVLFVLFVDKLWSTSLHHEALGKHFLRKKGK